MKRNHMTDNANSQEITLGIIFLSAAIFKTLSFGKWN